MSEDIPAGKSRIGLLRTFSQFISRFDFARQAGFQFDGKRDLYKALGYQRSVELRNIRERYERGGIAARIVDAKPQATWRKAPRVTNADPGAEKTDFETRWDALEQQFSIYSVLERADKLAGLGRFSVVFLGLRGAATLENDPGTLQNDALLYLTPYSEQKANVHEWVTDQQDPRFGLPKTYQIEIGSRDGRSAEKRVVHWKRVLHVADGLLDDDVLGHSRLLQVWNLLDDLEKVVGGAAEMFFRGGYPGLHANADPEVHISEEAKKQFDEDFAKYEHEITRMLMTQGVDIKPLGAGATPDPRGAFDTIIAEIAGTTEIPQRILMGSEQGQLASTQDQHNWDQRVVERQKTFGSGVVLRPLVDRLIALGILGESDFRIEWPDFESLSLESRARIGVEQARGAVSIGQQQNLVITPSEWRQSIGLPPEIPAAPDFVPAKPPQNEPRSDTSEGTPEQGDTDE